MCAYAEPTPGTDPVPTTTPVPTFFDWRLEATEAPAKLIENRS
jgi:hypothetical protein